MHLRPICKYKYQFCVVVFSFKHRTHFFIKSIYYNICILTIFKEINKLGTKGQLLKNPAFFPIPPFNEFYINAFNKIRLCYWGRIFGKGKYYHLYTRIQRLRRHADDNNVLNKLQFLVMPLNDRVVAMLN